MRSLIRITVFLVADRCVPSGGIINEERISELQEKQKQLKEQEKKLRAQQSQAERKLRTKHLIEMGAAIYSVLGDEYHDGDKEKMIAFLKEQDRRGSYFSTAMGRPKKNNSQS